MITTTDTLLKELVTINDEISTVTPLSFPNYQAGLVLSNLAREKMRSGSPIRMRK